MRPALLLVDLQHDFLNSPGLEPAAGQFVERASRLLAGSRALSVPVIHIWTTVNPPGHVPDSRMPHWKRAGLWSCVVGTEGHDVPSPLQPAADEPIIHKRFFSAFETGELDELLKSLEVDTVIFAGVHLHGCIRASAFDAYQRGFDIVVAEDAVGSNDPLHAAITQRYLERRAARFMPTEALLALLSQTGTPLRASESPPPSLPAAIVANETLGGADLERWTHISPRRREEPLWSVPICGAVQITQATVAAREAWTQWRTTPIETRVGLLERLAESLKAELESLARQMALEVGKPITQARGEVRRTIALLEATVRRADEPLEIGCTEGSRIRYRPLGVVAVVTPWNNPLAIPLGKIGPALFYGNTVVWKPALPGAALAIKVMELLHAAGCPPGVVNIICGDRSTALALMTDHGVDAITFSGSSAAGYAVQEIGASRHIPVQAELGGNNAAIVWHDCDIEAAAAKIAEGAFGFAGQRCTANRRAIVDARCYDACMSALERATAGLNWGDPMDERTQIGPLISKSACERVAALIERVKPTAKVVFTPHQSHPSSTGLSHNSSYYPPTIIACDDAGHEIVQEETFGPVLVVQRATDWSHALQLCNGVRQGLIAALFSDSPEKQAQFLAQAQAGILKINSATADANAEAPFGGWKASGIGPPEHGIGNRAFYTRLQSIYTSPNSR